eukprot:2164262-Lingulodinium_polyedra.AAC.1
MGPTAARTHGASPKGWKPTSDARCALSSSSTACKSVSSSTRGAGCRALVAAGAAALGCWQRRHAARLCQLPSQPHAAQ